MECIFVIDVSKDSAEVAILANDKVLQVLVQSLLRESASCIMN